MPLPSQSDTAYLMCAGCTWVLPIMHTDEDGRCPQCEGRLVVVDDHELQEVQEPMTAQSDDAVRYWHDQFQYALAGLSWAVGALGENAGYAGRVHDQLTNPVLHFPTANVEECESPNATPRSPFGA